MMLNITEEQSVNGAFNLTTQGIRAGLRFSSWLEKRKKEKTSQADIKASKKAEDLRSDACSYYRGGHVQNADEPQMQELIRDLRGTEFTRADGNFVFLGDKSDLSYFWKKNEQNENVVLLRSCVDSIEDSSIKRGTISALTQAKEKGFLTFDGKAYALTEKGKEAVLDLGFIANRLKSEEVFFEKGLLEDACSYYRGGFVKNGTEPKMQELIADLRGTEFTRADGNFIFLGDKSDLSYFWKKNEKNEPLVLLRSYVDGIEDASVKRGTISALTQAKERGFLTFDGEAYALTAKGKEAVLDPGFIANRLKAEEVFFEKAWQGLKESSQKLYVFEEAGKEPTEYYHIGNIKGADGNDFMKLVSEDKQELILPNDAKGKIAFESKEAGTEFVKENPDKVKDLQEYVRVYKAEKEKELYPSENYANTYVESENGYTVTLNNGEKLELPKEDVVKLEDGSIKADIYYDKQYTLHIKDQKTTLSGAGVKEQLSKNATKATAEAAKATVSTVDNTTVNAADAAATAFPPAKAVTSTVNVVYKIAQGASSAASTVGGASQKL